MRKENPPDVWVPLRAPAKRASETAERISCRCWERKKHRLIAKMVVEQEADLIVNKNHPFGPAGGR